MNAELDDQPEGHQGAGDVGHRPAGVAHDLEDSRLVVVFEAGLVEREAGVAQRVVHVDDDFAILFRELNAQVDENAKAGEKTLVILDVASHGFQDNFHFIVCNDENALKVNYPFENVMKFAVFLSYLLQI